MRRGTNLGRLGDFNQAVILESIRRAPQALHQGQGDQFDVADFRADSDSWTVGKMFWVTLQNVVDDDIECSSKGVQIGVHHDLRVVNVG